MSNYFEDVVLGETIELGSHTFTAEDIIDFARAYDPQPFHLDEEAGKASLFGGLSASGWHTAAVFISKVVAQRQAIEAAMLARSERPAAWGPSPGFKNLRWPKPVLVGDTISFRTQRTGKVDLKSRPTHGLVLADNEGFNQRGEKVFAISTSILVERREPYRGTGPTAR
jgi:acyl dehydratase